MRLQPLSHAMQEDPQENLGQSLTKDCKLLSSSGNLYLVLEREAGEDPHLTPSTVPDKRCWWENRRGWCCRV